MQRGLLFLLSSACLPSTSQLPILNIQLPRVKGQVKHRKPSWLVLLRYRWSCVTNRCCSGLCPAAALCVCVCVCLIVPDHSFPGFPLTSWPLYPVRRVNAAFNQFYRLTHTHTPNAADPVHPCSVKHASLRFNWSPAHTPLSQPLPGTHLILPALLTPPT